MLPTAAGGTPRGTIGAQPFLSRDRAVVSYRLRGGVDLIVSVSENLGQSDR